MEEVDRPQRRELRVVARRQAGGMGEGRRRIFQRHLLIFLAVNGAILGFDLMTAPGIQFWHWIGFFTGVFLLVHLGGLLSRGFSPGELLIPPRTPPPLDGDAPPLEYELVKARQLRDGVTRAAAAVREREPPLVDAAVEAAGGLESAVARLVDAARSAGLVEDTDTREGLEDDLEETLRRLDALHAGLIQAALGGGELQETIPIDSAREHLDRLGQRIERLET